MKPVEHHAAAIVAIQGRVADMELGRLLHADPILYLKTVKHLIDERIIRPRYVEYQRHYEPVPVIRCVHVGMPVEVTA